MRTKKHPTFVRLPYDGPLPSTRTPESSGELAAATASLNADPVGITKGRPKLDQGTTVKKELAFNTYLSQLEEPRSFLNLLPESMKKAVVSIPQELVDCDEDSLLKILEEKYNYKPTAALRQCALTSG